MLTRASERRLTKLVPQLPWCPLPGLETGTRGYRAKRSPDVRSVQRASRPGGEDQVGLSPTPTGIFALLQLPLAMGGDGTDAPDEGFVGTAWS